MTLPASDINWEAIERDYRCGMLSLREMATKSGNVTESAIRKRAKRDDWTRDLNGKIHAKAVELERKRVVRNLVRTERTIADKQQVDSMAQEEADVRLRLKTMIARGNALFKALLTEVERLTNDGVHVRELGKLMRRPNDTGIDRLNDIYKKTISTPSRVDMTKKLVDILKSVVALEREAYGLNDEPVAAENPLAAFLRGMKGSTLPVVNDVPRDETLYPH